MAIHSTRPPSRTADPCWWSAVEVAGAIAAKEISAREYLELLLARIERHNAAFNLVVTLDERALGRARDADNAVARGEALGSLHGVPITVKDSLATAGLPTTGGKRELAGYVPGQDAQVVAALRRAGAIVFGKTNLAENSLDLQARNELFGVSRNPWSPDHTTGGSSGGSAGAVAAGFTPLDVGSDVAGSIRVPAANCGVMGHKPSYGVVPVAGHLPPGRLAQPDLMVVGPIGRSAEDLDLVLGLLAAPHSWDLPAWRVSLPPARPPRRVAAWIDDPYCPVDDEIRLALEHTAELLASNGVVVEHARPDGVRPDVSDQVFRRLLASVAAPAYDPAEIEQLALEDAPSPAELGGQFAAQRYRDWLAADEQRTRLRMRWSQFFTQYDAILLPVAPNLALTHDDRPFADRRITVNGVERPYWDQIVWAGLTGVSYLPTTVVPVRRDSRGVPIGVAIAGPYLEDRSTLCAARMVAEMLRPIGHPLA